MFEPSTAAAVSSPRCSTLSLPIRQVRWLQEELDLTYAEVAAMVASAPNVLTISIQDSMAPKLGWLSRRLMLSNEQLALVVTTCPQVGWD